MRLMLINGKAGGGALRVERMEQQDFSMVSEEQVKRSKREYPPFFERLVPFALSLIAIAILILLLIIFGVVVGLFPGSG
jgi:lipopolysaccharide/colanic/teichoic acid biosynthesis glycosyltransferase